MADRIKGLTIEISGDTTKLGKALEDVNKKSRDLSGELKDVNRLLKLDPGNSDLLAQKQKILADAIENTGEKLKRLKEAERQVQAQFERGEVSEEQVRALRREVIDTEKRLDSYKRAAKETADEVANLGKKSKEALKQTEQVNNKLAGGLAKGLKGVAVGAGAAVTALAATAESTREYRTEMGKLDTAFTTNGHSSDAAKKTYQELQSILGETDQAVEAANHLAKLTDNEKDLETWTDICTGVYATFGASLPIEGLTEAANETAKVGAVTGPLADALNWAGVSEDEFNEKLEACSSEQERQALITETLNGLYAEAANKYRETNAEVIAANQANEEWAAGLAQVGAAVEPVMTKVKGIGADLLQLVVPAIQTLLNNLPALGVALGGVTAAMTAFKIAALAAKAAQEGMTLAQYAAAAAQKALNIAMSANPIGLIILAITALVTAFMLLWKNSESFRNFWINLWAKIKEVVGTAVEYIKALPERIRETFNNAIARASEWVAGMTTKAREAGSNFINSVASFFRQLPGRIGSFLSSVVSRVVSWAANMVSQAKSAGSRFLTAVVSFFRQLPGQIKSFLLNVVSSVASWASSLAEKGADAAKRLVSAVTNGLKSLPKKMLSIGKNLVMGLWNGIKDKITWLKNKIKSFADSVLGGLKDALGINSPSKETAWVGDMLDQGLAEGVEKNADAPIRAMRRVSSGVLDAAAGEVGGIGFERQLAAQRPAAAAYGAVPGVDSSLLHKLDAIYERLDRLQVVMDSGTLVGELLDKIDAGLAVNQMLKARGV